MRGEADFVGGAGGEVDDTKMEIGIDGSGKARFLAREQQGFTTADEVQFTDTCPWRN